jgi:hypothetical protein
MNFATLHKHAKTLYQASERLLLALEKEMEKEAQPAVIAEVPTETLLEEPKRVETPVVVKSVKK